MQHKWEGHVLFGGQPTSEIPLLPSSPYSTRLSGEIYQIERLNDWARERVYVVVHSRALRVSYGGYLVRYTRPASLSYRGQIQVGSLSGAEHLSNDNAGVPRPAQRDQKSRVEHKGLCWLDLDFQYE